MKYGRAHRDPASLADRLSKLTLHSVVKKRNRISMKLSNALGRRSLAAADAHFDALEARLHHHEKLIKAFAKDSLQHLAALKEFFKAQSGASESILEYYGEHR